MIKKNQALKVDIRVYRELTAEFPYHTDRAKSWNFIINGSSSHSHETLTWSDWTAYITDYDGSNVALLKFETDSVRELIDTIDQLSALVRDSYDKKEGKYGNIPTFVLEGSEWVRVAKNDPTPEGDAYPQS